MIKKIISQSKNFKYNQSEKSSNIQETLSLDALKIICQKPIQEIIPELYVLNMKRIEKCQSEISVLKQKIENCQKDIAQRDLPNRIETLKATDYEADELKTLEVTLKRLNYAISNLKEDLYRAEIELNDYTTSDLSQALGLLPSIRSQETLDRQKNYIEVKYSNFDIQLVSIVIPLPPLTV